MKPRRRISESAEYKLDRRTLISAFTACFYTGMAYARRLDARTTNAAYLVTPDLAQAQLALALQVVSTLARLGKPLSDGDIRQIQQLRDAGDLVGAARLAERLLDSRVLLAVTVNPEGQVGLTAGAAPAVLMEGGWRLFVARIDNRSLVPGRFVASSPESVPVHGLEPPERPNGTAIGPGPAVATREGDIAARWLDLVVFNGEELPAALAPLPIDYKILQLYARDAGTRSARIRCAVGAGNSEQGEHDALTVQFDVLESRTVQFGVYDVDGAPVTCSWLITDALARVYPSPARRMSPDLYFQRRIYRAHGESLRLPAGDYQVETGRGPEYLVESDRRRVAAGGETRWDIKLKRWIDPRSRGWYSGDHHIHAAGCAHYMQPTEGVGPDVMARQVRGEALSIGAVLTWGPGFYTQKLHFTGHDDPQSGAHERLRYDLEVYGFPSSHCGHTVLLQMKSVDYPGAELIEHWTSSNTPILRWARAQGAITGYAHSGWGLIVPDTDLPNDAMPAFDGIGANDYIVTVTAGLVDFISACNTPVAAELNIWYHTLNVGLRTRVSGETDWPCIFDERVGLGRSYVKIDGKLTYEAWCLGLKQGRCYISDGRAHLIDFRANARGFTTHVGGADLVLAAPAPVTIEIDAAARLEPSTSEATEAIRRLGPEEKPYWHLERARLGASRQVAIELLVNGISVESRALEADGVIRPIAFTYAPKVSCWIALRIRGAAHTNPIWVNVGGAPIRVGRSARWCRRAVEQCWTQKVLRIREAERAAEAATYDVARAFYDRMVAESPS